MIGRITEKLWRGTGRSTARYCDELGEAISVERLLRNGPRAALGGVGRLLFGYRPARPWISYDLSNAMDRLLDPARSRVLEFGSGMSTAWYASRAARVLAHESNSGWHARVAGQLDGQGNVELRLAPDIDSYLAVPEGDRFDLIMIDGEWRDACVPVAISHLAQGGVIVLDNCDKQDKGVGDVAKARAMLIEFARREGLPFGEITDFAPTAFFVQRALWVGPGLSL